MRLLRPCGWMRWLCALSVCATGCSPTKNFSFSSASPSYYQNFATQIEYPNVKSCLVPEVASVIAPLAVENPADLPVWEMTLDEATSTALNRSDILRSLGGSVVQAPQAARSVFDPASTESNPLGGVDAALSAFDAQVTGALFWNKNNRPNNRPRPTLDPNDPNNLFRTISPEAFEQTSGTFRSQVAKQTATGASFAARHNIIYDNNNNPGRAFTSDFTGWFEAEWRQPLMRGAGVDYNRIAGPSSGIGQYSGVLIARINTDISLADFEQSITTFVNDVETAYWELYYAYRNLQTQIAGRNSSLLTWQRVKELQKVGARGGEADNEAQARSQYYLFDAQVKEALAGTSGLYAAEQRLRYLMGLPPSDGRLLKPTEEPMEGSVVYDWPASLGDALCRRVEIRRQKWSIKRRELELVAARLNRRPTLDALTLYRFRGLGDHLIGSPQPGALPISETLYENILTGSYQEWQAGFELGYPVGFRHASAAISNAQWNLAREQSLLKEQELRISHDLSNAARQIWRSYELVQTNYNRQDADKLQVEVLRNRYEQGLININFLLQAQQQLASSQSAYFRSLVDYQLALRDFHREKGSLLNYSQVALSESAWPSPAYQNAAERGRFFEPRVNPEAVEIPRPVSVGNFAPHTVGSAPAVVAEP